MRIYNYTSQGSSDNPILKFVGKDVWVEAYDNDGYYYYFRFLSSDGQWVTVNYISADIIDDLDANALLDYFPRYPAKPINLDSFFTETFEYLLSDLTIYEEDGIPLFILTSLEIRERLQECLQKPTGGAL